ncbi:hypothetical protein EIP91_008479 [Steccherinum ochraceum]|uniref:Coilin n=1 Tax=Steccherinum ochraceum TaxID=92696 RepID=A0A4R0RPU3_9APHY|nr:hypothetical protein EIP91_008479 [Steccherinum ochraceum]
MIRIKVETKPPLPPLKAWHLVESSPTIAHIKRTLCTTLLPGQIAQNITLSLDGFLLLDPTPSTVLRDGDLLHIEKQNLPSSTSTASMPVASSSTLPGPRPPKRPLPTDTDSDSSSEKSSDEESSSDSSEDSTSDSDSSSSGSSVDSEPTEVSSKQVTSKQGPVHYVPPGQGKLATQRRNVRRRTKKQYDRLALQEPNDPSNPNDIPVDVGLKRANVKKANSKHLPDTASTPIMMASLSNKNKRRGFKQAMSSARPAKIVFEKDPIHSDATPSEEPGLLPFQSTSDTGVLSSTSHARLVPPSEKQAAGLLPSNVFVTSIDVEDPESRDDEGYVDADNVEQQLEPDEIVLPYDDPVPSVDFGEVHRKWESLPVISQPSQVKTGSLMGWKTLGLNPVTCTPEICLYIGRVIKNTADQLLVSKLVDNTMDGAHVLGGDIAMEEEEEYAWPAILSEGWRMVQ